MMMLLLKLVLLEGIVCPSADKVGCCFIHKSAGEDSRVPLDAHKESKRCGANLC